MKVSLREGKSITKGGQVEAGTQGRSEKQKPQKDAAFSLGLVSCLVRSRKIKRDAPRCQTELDNSQSRLSSQMTLDCVCHVDNEIKLDKL